MLPQHDALSLQGANTFLLCASFLLLLPRPPQCPGAPSQGIYPTPLPWTSPEFRTSSELSAMSVMLHHSYYHYLTWSFRCHVTSWLLICSYLTSRLFLFSAQWWPSSWSTFRSVSLLRPSVPRVLAELALSSQLGFRRVLCCRPAYPSTLFGLSVCAVV